jgi:hypothetical protein
MDIALYDLNFREQEKHLPAACQDNFEYYCLLTIFNVL